MTDITARILAGEIVLTQSPTGLAAVALVEKITGTSIVTGQPVLNLRITATKKSGETVDMKPTHIIGRTTVEGREVIKVAVTECDSFTTSYSVPRPVSGACRCDGDADTHGVCYQCGGYQRQADAGRHF